ncbi:hypothetical Protein YC6258_05786 [Gynuella sunshinyii YC6258]|uniref:Uncharacterized protein n=1 Tax=Gynuella sunshinyii YC6258 TaxID=1445510 RepID=A0A0C5W5E6_9GAMM|nr:hypothetical Protein YC6258_05786 [Gynuella sunshinyii YC6258]
MFDKPTNSRCDTQEIMYLLISDKLRKQGHQVSDGCLR